MLADGLQGAHLYVLYKGYGISVASVYCLGFIIGALTAPITGPLIDRFGRKKSELLYCAREVGINMLEQFSFLSDLIVSRVVGGITTNLLSTIFETWLDTEYRNGALPKKTTKLSCVILCWLVIYRSSHCFRLFGSMFPLEVSRKLL
uniref:Molybdate-anion transporter n=1 Tax=Pseudo-nitzschia delicatissima TaxID=44447 RepID=A0A7S0UGS1_9STRA|mmetsp:Transcript_3786/g.7861  ORF Transcript_3786/g.7861 Transcript_3786/m.7861 type:complete len:147 (+) Transcript_3786:228-668(+)